MRIDLLVPYESKDEARRLGARWDSARKTWYVENIENLEPFLKWMPAWHRRPTKSTLPTNVRPERKPKAPHQKALRFSK